MKVTPEVWFLILFLESGLGLAATGWLCLSGWIVSSPPEFIVCLHMLVLMRWAGWVDYIQEVVFEVQSLKPTLQA